MEIIRKPKPPATEIISIRVIAGIKKEHAKASDTAKRLDIDMTQMITNALTDVYNSITRMDRNKRVNTDVNVNTEVNSNANGEVK
jgi:hypothetical protein